MSYKASFQVIFPTHLEPLHLCSSSCGHFNFTIQAKRKIGMADILMNPSVAAWIPIGKALTALTGLGFLMGAIPLTWQLEGKPVAICCD